MTPLQIEAKARNKLNASTDQLWSSSEIIEDYLYEVCLEFSREVECIEDTFTTSSVASQQEYSLPSRYLKIMRVTWNNIKLQPITLREYDALTFNAQTIPEGTPAYYYYFAGTIGLYPIPSDVETIKVWAIEAHDVITSASTLDIPIQYHDMLVDGVTAKMAMKEIGDPRQAFYAGRWAQHLEVAKRQWRIHRRRDKPGMVQMEEMLPSTDFGVI